MCTWTGRSSESMSMNTRIGAGEQIAPLTRSAQMLSEHSVELTGVPEGELPQQGSDGRGRAHPVEEGLHPAAAHDLEVIDAVRAGRHVRDHRGQLGRRAGRTRGDPGLDDVNSAVEQPRSSRSARPASLGARNEIAVIEYREVRGEAVGYLRRQCPFLNWSD